MTSTSTFATGPLGQVFDAVAPASFDVQVDGRLVQVGRESGEYFLFLAMCCDFDTRYMNYGRLIGFTAAGLMESTSSGLPEVVVRQNRQKRTYVNHVLARSEVKSTYATVSHQRHRDDGPLAGAQTSSRWMEVARTWQAEKSSTSSTQSGASRR
jgi:hypothetical protein